jgi:type IV secretory pathway VirB2 component (pilin)
MALPINRAVDEIVVSARMADVATTTSCWAVAPCKGRLKRMYSVVHGTTSGAIAVISVAIDGATALTDTLSIADGAVAGEVDSVEFGQGVLCDVNEGSKIDIDSDGGGGSTVIADFALVIEKT